MYRRCAGCFFICLVGVVLFFLSQFRKLTCNVRAAEEGQKIEQKTEEVTQTRKNKENKRDKGEIFLAVPFKKAVTNTV